jgi:hypothetical protein
MSEMQTAGENDVRCCPKADKMSGAANVRFVPQADIASAVQNNDEAANSGGLRDQSEEVLT